MNNEKSEKTKAEPVSKNNDEDGEARDLECSECGRPMECLNEEGLKVKGPRWNNKIPVLTPAEPGKEIPATFWLCPRCNTATFGALKVEKCGVVVRITVERPIYCINPACEALPEDSITGETL